MTEEQNFLAYKIPILLKENYSKSQAAAIAYSMYKRGERTPKAQQGNWNVPPFENSLEGNSMYSGYNMQPQVVNQNLPAPTYYDQNKTYFETGQPNSPQYQDVLKRDSEIYKQGDANLDGTIDKITPQNKQTQNINEVNILNPYTGVDLNNSLYYAGRGFGEKDPWKAGLGTGLSLLKGGREFLSGFASGTEDRRVMQEYDNTLNKKNNNYVYSQGYGTQSTYGGLQQGGQMKLTNADMLTGQYLADEGQGNVNMESDEFVKRNTGEVQQVIGEKHVRNGKEAEGVDVNLNQGDKALSNTKILPLGAKNAKELRDRYNITVKAKDTFATAQKKIDSKIGYKKETDKLADLIEKFGANEKIKDATTKDLNKTVLSEKMIAIKSKIDALNEVRGTVFEDLYQRQESLPKKGNPGDLFTDDGKLVTEKNEGVAQQGGIQSQAEEQMEGSNSNQQEEQGEISPQQIIQAYAQASGQDPQAIMQQLQQMQPEEQQQALQAMEQELQSGNEQGEPNQSMQEENQEMNGTAQQGGLMEIAKKYNISPDRAQELIGLTQTVAQQGGWEDKLKKDYPYGRGAETQYVSGAFEEPNYGLESIGDIAKRFKFLADQRGIDYSKLDLTTRDGVNALAGMTQQFDKKQTPGLEQDYGMNVGLTRKGIEYFVNTPTFKKLEKDNPTLAAKLKNAKRGTYDVGNFSKEDRDAVMGEIKNSGDTAFADKNYLDNEAFFRGIDKQNIYFKDKDEFEKYKKEKGTAIDGYYKTDKKGIYVKPILLQPKEFKTEKERLDWEAKYGKNKEAQHNTFYSEDPNSDVYYTPFNPAEPQKSNPEVSGQTVDVQKNTKNYMPQFPEDLRLPPSALTPLNKPYVPFGRLEPIKATPEPMLAEQERLRQTDLERINQTGLAPQQVEALSSAGLASSQMAANDAIGKTENFNAQNQFQTDQYNLGNAIKESASNAQFSQKYQDQMLGSMANTERDWRNFYTEGNLQNRVNYNDVENANYLNAKNEQYAVVPGQGVIFKDNRATNLSTTMLDKETWDAMTAEEQNAWTINHNREKAAAEKMKNYKNAIK